MGLVIRTGIFPINLSFFSSAITETESFLNIHIAYLGIIIALLIIAAIIIAVYHTGKTFFEAGDYWIYIFGLGLFGGMLLIVGFLGALSIIGLILMIIGIIASYKIERAPPGTPEYRTEK